MFHVEQRRWIGNTVDTGPSRSWGVPRSPLRCSTWNIARVLNTSGPPFEAMNTQLSAVVGNAHRLQLSDGPPWRTVRRIADEDRASGPHQPRRHVERDQRGSEAAGGHHVHRTLGHRFEQLPNIEIEHRDAINKSQCTNTESQEVNALRPPFHQFDGQPGPVDGDDERRKATTRSEVDRGQRRGRAGRYEVPGMDDRVVHCHRADASAALDLLQHTSEVGVVTHVRVR